MTIHVAQSICRHVHRYTSPPKEYMYIYACIHVDVYACTYVQIKIIMFLIRIYSAKAY
jgi:hypothetical protein